MRLDYSCFSRVLEANTSYLPCYVFLVVEVQEQIASITGSIALGRRRN